MDDTGRDDRWGWVAGFRDRLHRRLAARVGADYADDATQEALLRAVAAPSTPRVGARLAWLTRIGLNWRIDEARTARHLDALDAAEHVSFDVPTVEPVDLRAALRNLSRADRHLLLRAARGERYEELAQRLGISPVAVRQRVARARLRLARELSVDRKSVRGVDHDNG